ncbi:MAG: hypothetical protein AAFX03_12895 [Pseudomonadota bacterium]
MRSVLAYPVIRAAIAAAVTLTFIGLAPAEAQHRDRVARCDVVYDQFGRPVAKRNCVSEDRFFRAGPNRAGAVATIGRDGRIDRRGRRGDFYRGERGRRGGRDIVFRDVIPARGRARIIVTEEIVYRRRGPRRICTVTPVGVDAGFIPYRRLERVAARNCSRRARIRIRG